MKTSALKLMSLGILAGALTITGHGQLSGPRAVEGAGCVWEGVEAGCLMVTDRESDVTYNLLISGDKPAPGTGIFFMGTLHQGQTSCMQAHPVDVKSWTKRKMNCSAPEKKKGPSPY